MIPDNFRIVNDDNETLGEEKSYDRACALGRELSKAVGYTEVRADNRSGRVYASYRNGRETFYTYTGPARRYS